MFVREIQVISFLFIFKFYSGYFFKTLFFEECEYYIVGSRETVLKSRNFFSSNSWRHAWHPASDFCARMVGKIPIAAGHSQLHANLEQT